MISSKHRVISILLTVLMLVSAMSALATSNLFSASAAASKSVVYFDNSFGWDKVYVYAHGTKENAKWPGEQMTQDANGLYYYEMDSTFKSESIIVNNGQDKTVTPDTAQQYPENAGLPIKLGECKFLVNKEWIDYGTADGGPAAFAYTAAGTSTSKDTLQVKIGLKDAVKGTYCIDGGVVKEYTGTTTITVGQGKIANSDIELKLTATGSDGTTTSTTIKYKKSFTETKTTFSSPSDGHTTEPISGYYGTNPNMQLGKEKTIAVDGDVSDWDSSMIIAQGVANDDPRVYMPSSMHEQPWDDYALYAAWDNDNIYFMWEWVNTTYIVSPGDNFAASDEARPYRNSIPIFLALSVDPTKSGTGAAKETDKTGAVKNYPYVWGSDKDGGVSYSTKVDKIVCFDTNNSNGGDAIISVNDDGIFDYDTSIKIGVNSYQAQDNKNGFKIKFGKGTKSDKIIGVNGAKGSRIMGDSYDSGSNWVDFFDLGYKSTYGYIYEISIPLKNLGIDKNYIENQGIGAMKITTYGTSGMNSLPHDPSVLDQANVEYGPDPSTSHEKEDVDNISVPLARIGALLPDTVINEAPLQVNFGTDKSGAQNVGASLNLKAQAYSGTGPYTYDFSVNGKSVQKSSSDTAAWVPTEKGTYSIGVTVTDSKGQSVSSTKQFTIGESDVIPTEPETTAPTTVKPTVPTTTAPSTTQPGSTSPTTATTAPVSTDPSTTVETTTSAQQLEKGDANGDGTVNIKDVTEIQKYIASLSTLNEQQKKAADYDGDGEIKITDATAIQKALAQL